jgi:hypothetical protein
MGLDAADLGFHGITWEIMGRQWEYPEKTKENPVIAKHC